jgi:hypothetical protein
MYEELDIHIQVPQRLRSTTGMMSHNDVINHIGRRSWLSMKREQYLSPTQVLWFRTINDQINTCKIIKD